MFVIFQNPLRFAKKLPQFWQNHFSKKPTQNFPTEIFHRKVQPQGSSPKQCFNPFKLKTKEQPNDILQGSHKFLLNSLRGKLEEPTVDELIEIFQVFSKGTTKRCLFKSIKKVLNLDLALSVVQDLISNGPAPDLLV